MDFAYGLDGLTAGIGHPVYGQAAPENQSAFFSCLIGDEIYFQFPSFLPLEA